MFKGPKIVGMCDRVVKDSRFAKWPEVCRSRTMWTYGCVNFEAQCVLMEGNGRVERNLRVCGRS